MYPATERFPSPAAAPITLPQSSSKDSFCFPLKTLIGAVTAVASVVFGFWIAGFMGAMIALTITGITAAIHLTNTNKEPDIDSICRGEPLLADDSILWIMGTESAHLANILAFCRKKRSENPQAPAVYLSNKFTEELAFVPVETHLTRARKKSPDFATRPLLEAIAAFDLKKELEKAHILPGEKSRVVDTTIREYIEQYSEDLITTIISLTQRLSVQQKQELNTHVQMNILPIFASKETLVAHLSRYPQFDTAILWQEDPQLDGIDFANYREELNVIKEFFELQVIEFNTIEKDLIHHSCPLIFASTTVGCREIAPNIEEPAGRVRLDKDPERLAFGTDLQIIYTTAPNIKRIQAAVKPFGVEVRDLKYLTKPN